ncbi:MAG TPA: hypothetical protein VE954_28135 [Oligoflexus sp.]|uniref:hypothetical protein n=1 Tax=Oligoflexus sp. TaxID=1971216 RepID=UPI002D60E5D1|nr:hypothetical protein [Oligoflexus sp.]HYX36988.1 hypothetical protein [Oligoflexus sp.]
MQFRWLMMAGFISSPVWAQDPSGLKISASVDLVGSYKADQKSTAEDKFAPREAEIILTAPIDATFDGMLSFAAHQEEGEAVSELHEAYIRSSRLIPRSNIRAGQFFLGLGRLNRLHRHEWPIIVAPKVHEAFFGEEGALDSGIEYSYLAPLPFFLETTLGVTNGFTYGHAHDEGEKPKKPTHYARIATYFDLPAQGGAQIALNYLSRTDAESTTTTLTGLDFTAKWREAGVLQYLVQSEIWHRTLTPDGGTSEETLGAYVLPQYAFDAQLSLGILIDYLSVLSLKDAAGNTVDNSILGVVPTLTYKASEFSTLRVAYNHSQTQREDQADSTEKRLELQATFIMGAHPAHDF